MNKLGDTIDTEYQESTMKWYYKIFCLTVESNFPIYSLQVVEKDLVREIDVVVRVGRKKEHLSLSRSQYFIFEKQNATILIEEGRKISFFPKGRINVVTLSWYFLNLAIITILYQRGFMVFHGSCISNGDMAYAFIGKSGVGKSTIAAFLRENGYHYLGDDICAVKITKNDSAMLYPSYPEIGLWPESEEFLNHTFSLPKRPRSYLLGKADFRITERFQDRPVPLKKLFILDPLINGKFQKRKINGGRAIHYLNEHTHLYISFIQACKFYKFHFQNCAKLTEVVEIWELDRPNLFELDKTLEQLLH